MASACPCIDVSHLLAAATTENCTLHMAAEGIPQDPVCYPVGYGSWCQAWDHGVASCNAANPAFYCTQSWCYVDHERCRRSEYDLTGTKLWPSLVGELYFSYGSCGSSDAARVDYNQAFDEDVGVHRALSVVIPAPNYPWHFKREPSSGALCGWEQRELQWCVDLAWDGSVAWEGAMIDYLERVRQVGGFKSFNYTMRSFSADLAIRQRPTGNNWTAAVHDVQ